MKIIYFLFVAVLCKKYNITDKNVTYPLGLNYPNKIQLIPKKFVNNDLPDRFDWRDKVDVPIRNQLSCGSCWAFATLSPIEYLYAIYTNTIIHISEQFLISCNNYGYSCKGGWWDFDDLIQNGLALNDNYTYDSIDEQCKINIQLFNKISVLTWQYIDESVESLKYAIYKYGPIVSGVFVSNDFYRYYDGIYDYYSTEKINHAVVLVGWDDSMNAWILRNSWGPKWGQNGYMYIQYNASSIGSNAAYVIISITKYLSKVK